jgi:hypothetical protein
MYIFVRMIIKKLFTILNVSFHTHLYIWRKVSPHLTIPHKPPTPHIPNVPIPHSCIISADITPLERVVELKDILPVICLAITTCFKEETSLREW